LHASKINILGQVNTIDSTFKHSHTSKVFSCSRQTVPNFDECASFPFGELSFCVREWATQRAGLEPLGDPSIHHRERNRTWQRCRALVRSPFSAGTAGAGTAVPVNLYAGKPACRCMGLELTTRGLVRSSVRRVGGPGRCRTTICVTVTGQSAVSLIGS